MGLIKTSSANAFSQDIKNCLPGVYIDIVNPKGANFPWSRIMANAVPGFVTRSQLKKLHINNKKFGLQDMFVGSITVPGINTLCLLDKIKVDIYTFYIQAITHNIDLQSKLWTTSLSLIRLHD